MKNFGIKEALSTLGIKKSNHGTSTGKKWYKSSGKRIESYSPADGSLIGSVYAAEENVFNHVVD
jgi:aldehyde dehydrogenase (NAD+)